MGLIKALLRFVVPLRSIATELTQLRKLYALELQHVHGIVLPDEKLLKTASKDTAIEIMYGTKEPDPAEWNADDGVNVP